MCPVRDFSAAHLLRTYATPLAEAQTGYSSLIETIGNSQLVLIGEASHGTHEFYEARARITQRLIEEKAFTVVAVEADWPDAYRVNRFVRLRSADRDPDEALSGFKRFPAWMWRNTVVRDFVDWMRGHNSRLPEERRAGVYGLDLYSLNTSITEVLSFLEKVDPEAARRARYRYSCFEDFGEDTQAYGYAASFNLDKSCEEQVIRQLTEMRQRAVDLANRDGRVEPDEFFYAEQNARLVKNAEEYYRSMFAGRVISWNLRDQHMADTLDALLSHLGKGTKAVLWAHNSHLGDARATQMGRSGEWNVGQLVRERHGSQAFLVGFTTYAGTVTAADNWDEPPQRFNVRPALPGSYEELLHEVEIPRFLLRSTGKKEVAEVLRRSRLERAIGVIYRPQTERISHYFDAVLPDQFDAVIHMDRTRALEPLEFGALWQPGEAPETYPSAL